MSLRRTIERLKEFSFEPEDRKEDWYSKAKEGVRFLCDNVRSGEIVVYATVSAHTYVHAVLAPSAHLQPPDFGDLRHMDVPADRSWVVQHVSGGGKPDRVYLEDPMGDTRCKSLAGGEKLVFRRAFHGVSDHENTVEISQKFVHCLNLHLLADRNAYCRLDDKGDVEEIIKITKVAKGRHILGGVIVTVRADCLYEYMVLGGYGLVTKYDFTRYQPGNFSTWASGTYGADQTDSYQHSYGFGPSASFVHGAMVMLPPITYEDVVARYVEGRDGGEKQYATFKIKDWRNDRLAEIRCAPENMTNYFAATPGLPFEVSPAFFRPEVLLKYKADPEKYTIGDRTIACRNSWHLSTYDINEEGQVHTYIVYLSHLPYEEQLYWQSFNEWPKSGISQRAFETDFEGTWSTAYDPLPSVKRQVEALDRAMPDWWKPRGETLTQVVHLPASESSSEWADEIMRMDQLLVEGFQVVSLRKLLSERGQPFEASWASLRLLQELLVASGEKVEDARSVLEPLKTLHQLRTKVKGHSAPSERRALESQARSEHGTFRRHFEHLAAGCDASMRRITALLAPGLLEPPADK